MKKVEALLDYIGAADAIHVNHVKDDKGNSWTKMLDRTIHALGPAGEDNTDSPALSLEFDDGTESDGYVDFTFTEGNILQAKVNGNLIHLEDYQGNPMTIQCFKLATLGPLVWDRDPFQEIKPLNDSMVLTESIHDMIALLIGEELYHSDEKRVANKVAEVADCLTGGKDPWVFIEGED